MLARKRSKDSTAKTRKTGDSPGAYPFAVLFMDVVGFSKCDMPKQKQIINALNESVEDAKKKFWRPCSQQAQPPNAPLNSPDVPEDIPKLLFLPTGDGMAIAFFLPAKGSEVEQPILWACQIMYFLDQWKKERKNRKMSFDLRIGLHAEDVDIVRDPNGRLNITGPGINMAQRVMDCGDAGHILASEDYRKRLLNHDSDLISYFYNAFTAYIKGGKRDTLFNVTKRLDGLRVGRIDEPAPKPHLLNEYLTTNGSPGQAALALCVSRSSEKRLNYIKDMQPVTGKTAILDTTEGILLRHSNCNYTTMELTSMIHPRGWTSGLWPGYSAQILRITSNRNSKGCIARRLHVIENDDFERKLDEIVPMMIADCICSIRSRVLRIPQDEVESLVGELPVYRWADFVLFDCGTYYSPGGVYSVIYSDLKPYFKATRNGRTREGSEFTVYAFDVREGRCIYEELRANFFRGWHNRAENSVLTLPDVVKKARKPSDRLKKWVPHVRRYLPTEAEQDLVRQKNWMTSVISLVKNSLDQEGHHKGEDHLCNRSIGLPNLIKAPLSQDTRV